MGNSINFVGNLGKDAEMKQAGSSNVLNFSVANTVGFGDKKQTLWMGCAIWGKKADSLEQYLKKGTKVWISGELSTREHEGKTYMQVRVNDLDFCGGRNDGDSAPAPAPSAPVQAETSEDMPF